jgi:hypothetical protein
MNKELPDWINVTEDIVLIEPVSVEPGTYTITTRPYLENY